MEKLWLKMSNKFAALFVSLIGIYKYKESDKNIPIHQWLGLNSYVKQMKAPFGKRPKTKTILSLYLNLPLRRNQRQLKNRNIINQDETECRHYSSKMSTAESAQIQITILHTRNSQTKYRPNLKFFFCLIKSHLAYLPAPISSTGNIAMP